MKDHCVICNAETPYDRETPVDYRQFYTEAGQLCKECHEKTYGPALIEIRAPKPPAKECPACKGRILEPVGLGFRTNTLRCTACNHEFPAR